MKKMKIDAQKQWKTRYVHVLSNKEHVQNKILFCKQKKKLFNLFFLSKSILNKVF